MSDDLPTPIGHNSHTGGDSRQSLSVNEINVIEDRYSGLAKLAEIDPGLAREALRAEERKHKRESRSFLFGMGMASSVVVAILVLGAVIIYSLGFWYSIASVLLFMAAGVLLHVLVNGEWPEKSFIGGAISAVLGGTGGRRRSDDGDGEKDDDE